MTDPNCKSGSDRVADAVKQIQADIVVNIQSDEPFSDAQIIDEAIQPLIDMPNIGFSNISSQQPHFFYT